FTLFHFFFFQAEDGIRDFHVTGVQTCALPICPRNSGFRSQGSPAKKSKRQDQRGYPTHGVSSRTTQKSTSVIERIQTTGRACLRSEERRVGKGCRALRIPSH